MESRAEILIKSHMHQFLIRNCRNYGESCRDEKHQDLQGLLGPQEVLSTCTLNPKPYKSCNEHGRGFKALMFRLEGFGFRDLCLGYGAMGCRV